MLEQLKQDIEQYQGAMEDFYSLIPEDIESAYQLAMVFMQLANRWAEIQLNANKYCTDLGVTRTAFKTMHTKNIDYRQKHMNFVEWFGDRVKRNLKTVLIKKYRRNKNV